MKVLVADKFEKSGIEGLRAAGCEVRLRARSEGPGAARGDPRRALPMSWSCAAPRLPRRCSTPAGSPSSCAPAPATTRSTSRPRRRAASTCPTVPGKNAIAVAELAFALMLALDRRIPDNVADLRAGVWNKKEYSNAHGLYGRTLGLLGAGSIGRNDPARRGLRPRRGALEPAVRRRGPAADRRGGARAGRRACARARSASTLRRRPPRSRRAPTSSAFTSRWGRKPRNLVERRRCSRG